MTAQPRPRDQRGVVFPSPVVMLSIIAVAMAAIAFVATRGNESPERQIATTARHQPVAPSTGATSSQPSAKPSPSRTPQPKPEPKPKPPVQRAKTYVEVYNNSGISGLAGSVATSATGAGWQVVGSDNWYGTIPASTVYYPQRLERAAKLLALDLGIARTAPAVDPMRLDRLTVILTGPLA